MHPHEDGLTLRDPEKNGLGAADQRLAQSGMDNVRPVLCAWAGAWAIGFQITGAMRAMPGRSYLHIVMYDG